MRNWGDEKKHHVIKKVKGEAFGVVMTTDKAEKVTD